LLELRCLRQHYVYISELNIFTLQEEIAITFDDYYKGIEHSIQDAKVFPVPKSLMWSTVELSNPTNQANTDFIRTKINSNELTERLYEQKRKLVEDSIDGLKDYCETIHELIEPVMDTDGITNVCKLFQTPTGVGSSLLTNLLEFPAYETRLWKWANIQDSNIDIDLTEAFNAQMARIYKWKQNMEGQEQGQGQVQEQKQGQVADSYNQDWIVLNEFPNNADVNALLKELTVKDDEAKLDRIKALLRCEIIVFEMSSKNNGEINYDYNKVMTGGSGFSKYDEITKAFKINASCDMLKSKYNNASTDVDSIPLRFLFLVKFSDVLASSYSYKLVYNNNVKYKSSQNYLYTYDDIHNNIPYIDFYIKYKCVRPRDIYIDLTKTEGVTKGKETEGKETKDVTKIELGEEKEKEQGITVKEKTSIIKSGTGLKLTVDDINKISDIIQLNKTRKSINKSLINRQYELDNSSTVLTDKRRKQLESDIDIFENQLNAVDQRIQYLQQGQGQGQKGGGPRDRYYSTQGIQELQENQYNNPNFQQPYPYSYGQQPYPYSYGQQPMYPTLNPGVMNPRTMNPRTMNPYMNMNPYGQQQMINPLQQHTYAKQMSYLNKTLELESKLAFYVNVELVLFPGASVSPLQKASALCGSRLGDIRKAVSDLFGFEYYQKPIDDAYIYQSGNSKEEKEEKGKKEEKGGKEEKGKKGGSIKRLKIKKSISKKRRNKK
jgi:hypothetical protein